MEEGEHTCAPLFTKYSTVGMEDTMRVSSVIARVPSCTTGVMAIYMIEETCESAPKHQIESENHSLDFRF